MDFNQLTKPYHTAVFIGRFSPFHMGHEQVIREGLKQAREVIVVVGSSFAARSFRNPFTFEERRDMIKSVFPESNVKVVPVSDYPYDDNKWVAAVQSLVMSNMAYTPDPTRIALIGHKKDETSYYLNLFKQWSSIGVDNFKGINATEIRSHMFTKKLEKVLLSNVVNDTIFKMLSNFVMSDGWDDLLEDYNKTQQYIDIWKSAPYPPTFVTGDAVLTQSGSVLLIQRGDFPFKDKWALPGGYLNQGERIVDGVIRELREETRVKVPEKVLRGSIKDSFVFDHPRRDPRGRTITHAYHIDLGFPNEGLPKAKGHDDAKAAKWVQYGELRQEQMAFDHWHILNHFLKLG